MQSQIDGMKMQKAWQWSDGCKNVNSKTERTFCQQLTALDSEARIRKLGEASRRPHGSSLRAKIDATAGTPALSEADPQAKVLTELANAFFPNIKIENVQMALTIFVALLLEVGSGFGMYVAFSQWRLDCPPANACHAENGADEGKHRCGSGGGSVSHRLPLKRKSRVLAPMTTCSIEIPLEVPVASTPAIEAQPAEVHQVETKVAESRSTMPVRRLAPETNTERFYKENIEVRDGSSVTATELYEDYCSWCESKNKEPAALPSFAREFADLGVKKEKVAGRVRYIGIALKSDMVLEEAMKPPLFGTVAA